MFSARGVALNVTTASVQLRMLQNSVYLPRGQSYHQLTVSKLLCFRKPAFYEECSTTCVRLELNHSHQDSKAVKGLSHVGMYQFLFPAWNELL
jgi:hypothetical protein